MSDDLKLVLAFDTDSPEFARGVELGSLWSQLMYGAEPEVVQLVHATNAEMVLRVAEALGASFTAVDVNDDWTEVTLRRLP